MANTPIFISGAETGNLTLEPVINSTNTAIVTSPTRPGSGARVYQCNPGTTVAGTVTFAPFSNTTDKNAGANIAATAFASFYFRVDTLPGSSTETIAGFFTLTSTTTQVATIRINSSGNLAVFDSTGTVISTGSTALTTTTWYRLDFSANRTTGAWALQINGVSEISGSGASLGATNIGNFSIGRITSATSQSVNFYYDDIWIDTQAFAPSTYAMVIDTATANGTTMSWTTSDSGVGDFSHINAIPASTATFVEDPAGTSLPVLAEFAMQTFAQMGINAASTILAIQPMAFFKDTTTIANTLSFGIISGATTSTNSTVQNTANVNTNFGRLIVNDPATGVAWTKSGLEAVQLYASEGTTAVNTQMAGGSITVAFIPATSGANSNMMSMGLG